MSITDEILRIQQAKSDLAASIAAKGVTVPAATTIDEYAALVSQIQTGPVLPYDAEIEYLQSNGSQYIDTGIIASGEFEILLGLEFSSPLNSGTVVCAGVRSSSQFLTLAQKNANTHDLAFGYAGNVWGSTFTIAANTKYNMGFHYADKSQYVFVNGTKYGNQTYSGTLNSDLSIYLFKRHHYSTDSVSGLQGKIYYTKIIKNGQMVGDFIPVRVGQVGCLYDRVSGGLFYNQGTGSFTLGSDVT